ncbi:MAG TPA: hypothetical protein VMR62_25905 [Bryobacteraceae bacterium]|jgi:hypothetical protein|nr:hypothetical protein [Bryobacteraceae bacterium]
MNYWLDLFTGTTWEEFRKAGANISGFRERMRKTARRVRPGDVFLCYLTGVMRWVGALEVGGPTRDSSPIWASDAFPVRFTVKPLVMLDPACGVPMRSFEGRLDFYRGPEHRGGFKAFLRMSPHLFKRDSDGLVILDALREAERNPVATPIDQRKLARKPSYFKVEYRKGKVAVPTVVSVPEQDDDEPGVAEPQLSSEPATRHTEIQYHLLRLGSELGLDVWVARNDRSRSYKGEMLGAMANMLDELPTQFNDATNRTIELIDVLWLKGNAILAAFEIEATTSIYSGLLRMSDLLALQPNLDLALYLVAPDERRAKVRQEIARPTFAYREKPLPKVCGFVGFGKFMEKVEGIRRLGLAGSLKPEFLKTTAEYFGDSDTDE